MKKLNQGPAALVLFFVISLMTSCGTQQIPEVASRPAASPTCTSTGTTATRVDADGRPLCAAALSLP